MVPLIIYASRKTGLPLDARIVDISTASSSIASEGIGNVVLTFGDYELILTGVIYAPRLKVNVLSTERLKKDHYIGYSNWFPHRLFEGETGRTIVEADISSGLPIISPGKTSEIDHFDALKTYYAETAVRPISLDLAHRRLGHISEKLVKQLADGRATGLKLKPKSAGRRNRCDDCIIGQMKAIPHPYRQPTLVRTSRPFERIHMDLLEAPVSSLADGFNYLLIIIDEHTRYMWTRGSL